MRILVRESEEFEVILLLLRPVHDWSMSVLKRIPMDGTFNQTAPLMRLVGSTDSYSYDLSSATDRWPFRIIHTTVQGQS